MTSRDREAVLILSGIFPPDVGGPATHAADLAVALRERSHVACVMTLHDGAGILRDANVTRVSRRWPWPVRAAFVIGLLVWRRRRFDVVYATGMQAEAVVGARLARRPVVVKVVGDPAWERGRRLGVVRDDFDDFQDAPSGSWRVRAMMVLRDFAVRHATAVVAPSEFLARVADRWAGMPGRTVVIPNGVRAPRRVARSGGAAAQLRAVYVGRLVSHKRVDLLIEAAAQTSGVSLDIIGDGPEDLALRDLARRVGDSHIRVLGGLDHDAVLDAMSGADVLVTAASYEGLPHTVIEALACGTPVVASAAGGTTEAVHDEINGLIVDPATTEGFAAAISRLRDDVELRGRLLRGAAESSEQWRFDRVVDQVESLLTRLVNRPRAIFLGRLGLDRGPDGTTVDRLSVIGRQFDATLVTDGTPPPRVGPVRTVRAPGGGVGYRVLGPLLAVALASTRRGTAIVCQGPLDAAPTIALSRAVPGRWRPRIVAEVHGDWRTVARLYGSRWRKQLAPLADAAARFALRNADGVRAVSRFTADLAREAGATEVDVYPGFTDLGTFLGPPAPLPHVPTCLFLGALERVKGVDVLMSAWPRVRSDIPAATLVLAGDGALGPDVRRFAETTSGVRVLGRVATEDVVALIDTATVVVVPSRSEGLGRVVLEAMARARPVVASAVGGIPELVEDGRTGLLVPPGREDLLANALRRVLGDSGSAASLGDSARRTVAGRDLRREFEAGVERLASWVASGP